MRIKLLADLPVQINGKPFRAGLTVDIGTRDAMRLMGAGLAEQITWVDDWKTSKQGPPVPERYQEQEANDE